MVEEDGAAAFCDALGNLFCIGPVFLTWRRGWQESTRPQDLALAFDGLGDKLVTMTLETGLRGAFAGFAIERSTRKHLRAAGVDMQQIAVLEAEAHNSVIQLDILDITLREYVYVQEMNKQDDFMFLKAVQLCALELNDTMPLGLI